MVIRLSDHFTYGKLLRFVLPSVAMMEFVSLYGIVDGLFVSNYTGKISFAAINLIMPFLLVLGALGFMLGTGGSALVAKQMGMGEEKKAKESFSMLVYCTIIGSLLLELFGQLFLRRMAIALGADEAMLVDCLRYGRIILLALPFFTLQNLFQSFCVTAERPKLGLGVTIAAGVMNMVLDALLVGVLHYGLIGAAVATAVTQTIGGMVPLCYFARKNTSRLQLTGMHFDKAVLFKSCSNGVSELMTNITSAFVAMLYNYQLMRYAGVDGVAAYSVLMYINFIFINAFSGYAIGSAPLVSYNYGAKNHAELQNIFSKSLKLIGIAAVMLTVLPMLLAKPLAGIFVGYDAGLLALTVRAFRIYAVSFLFCGFSMYGSSFFTALNNGKISALISFLRMLVFQTGCVLLLPLILGVDGIWIAVTVAEILSLILTAAFWAAKRETYHYA